MADAALVTTKVGFVEPEFRVGAELDAAQVEVPVRTFPLAFSGGRNLAPDEIERCWRFIADRASRPWRVDPVKRIRFEWYADHVVEYYVGSASELGKALGIEIESRGLGEREKGLWLLNIRPPTREELQFRPQEGRTSGMREEVDVLKVPSLIQTQIDAWIEKSKRGTLTEQEQASLDELLDYVDDLTIRELRHIQRGSA